MEIKVGSRPVATTSGQNLNNQGNVGSRPVATANILPCRKKLRAGFHDYSGGNYFITVCTQNKKHYFGDIFDGEIHLSQIGKVLESNINEISTHFSDVEIPVFVIMPNHLHAIIRIEGTDPEAVATGRDPTLITRHNSRLATVVGGIKAHVTRYARRNNIEFAWQSRYHDHIIRDYHDGNPISKYIGQNIGRREMDCYYK